MQKVREAVIAQRVPVNPRPSSERQVFAQLNPNTHGRGRGGGAVYGSPYLTGSQQHHYSHLPVTTELFPLDALFSRSQTVEKPLVSYVIFTTTCVHRCFFCFLFLTIHIQTVLNKGPVCKIWTDSRFFNIDKILNILPIYT